MWKFVRSLPLYTAYLLCWFHVQDKVIAPHWLVGPSMQPTFNAQGGNEKQAETERELAS